MYVKELWRFPVKSLRGERLSETKLTADGVPGDRLVHIRQNGGVVTARTRPGLLGLSATTGPDGNALVEGLPWQHPDVRRALVEAAGPGAEAVAYQGPERFDILPLLVATDGAIQALGFDGRRLRPNIVIGDVPGLAERAWPGRALRVGDAIIGLYSLRGRCVMTTIDPDTGEQNLDVLRRIHREFDGRLALNCWVAKPGTIAVGDPVEVLDATLPAPQPGGWIVGAPYSVA